MKNWRVFLNQRLLAPSTYELTTSDTKIRLKIRGLESRGAVSIDWTTCTIMVVGREKPGLEVMRDCILTFESK